MAVVNAREWMEEPLLKASIDPLPAPEESKDLNAAQGFLGGRKGADVQVSTVQGHWINNCKKQSKKNKNNIIVKSFSL